MVVVPASFIAGDSSRIAVTTEWLLLRISQVYEWKYVTSLPFTF